MSVRRIASRLRVDEWPNGEQPRRSAAEIVDVVAVACATSKNPERVLQVVIIELLLDIRRELAKANA